MRCLIAGSAIKHTHANVTHTRTGTGTHINQSKCTQHNRLTAIVNRLSTNHNQQCQSEEQTQLAVESMTSISVVSNSTLEWNLISPADVTGECVCLFLCVCAVAVAVFQSTKPSQKCSVAYLFKCLPLLMWLQLTCQAVALPKGSREREECSKDRERGSGRVKTGNPVSLFCWLLRFKDSFNFCALYTKLFKCPYM